MKVVEMRELGANELKQLIQERSYELADLKIKHKSGTGLEKPLRLRSLRRELARMKTVQAQREAK